MAGCNCPVAGCSVLLAGHVLQLRQFCNKVSMSQLTCIHSHVLPRCSVSFVSPPCALPLLCSLPASPLDLGCSHYPGPCLPASPPWASLHLPPSHCLACVAVSSSLFPLLSCDGPVGGCQGAGQQCKAAGAGVPWPDHDAHGPDHDAHGYLQVRAT